MKIVGGKWSNWSGGVVCKPKAIVAPKNELELAAAVRMGQGPVRTPGTGHSFTPLNETDGTIIDLSAFTGLTGFDAHEQVATFAAATPLWEIGSLIHPLGCALKNMGDIDRQTIGGVVGTGTHGTGPTLGSFSSEVASFRLLLASGEIIHCSPTENPDVFAAGRCSMGALGVMIDISMKLRPIYKLSEKNFLLPIDELWAKLDSLVNDNRHFEFFWFPYADVAVCKTLNESAASAPEPRSAEYMQKRGEKRAADASMFEWINEVLPYAPFLLRRAHRLFSGGMSAGDRVRWSHEILPSPRTTRFNEMEYAVPYEKGPETIRKIVGEIRRRKINTGFPIEYRTVHEDDVWLSPFYQRKSATIAVHQYHRVNTARLFDMCESVFRSVEGRPHWGKRHTRTREEFAELYPKFEDFRAVRARLDPAMKFLNAHLRAIFEG
ncbi:MAG: FAD-binding protein [Alphaproteobacteria bacterium]|nr:FAD-binding protein [Alphaproteobacteria bacterium]MBV9420795.1 FAD-binding protein [Alphaproteobacteria bacterium]